MEEEMIMSLMGVIFFAVIAVLASKAKNSKAQLPTVMLTSYKVDVERCQIEIEGRAPGLVAWLLKAVGLGSTTTFRANIHEVRLNAKNLQGESLTLVPGNSVSCVRARYQSPLWALLTLIFILSFSCLPILFLFMADSFDMESFAPIFFIDALFSVLLLLVYALGKKLVIEVDTHQGKGPTLGIGFQPSILDGVHMSMQQLSEAAELINLRLMQSTEEPPALALDK